MIFGSIYENLVPRWSLCCQLENYSVFVVLIGYLGGTDEGMNSLCPESPVDGRDI